MTVHIQRSVEKDGLPPTDGYYTVIQEGWAHQRVLLFISKVNMWESQEQGVTHWLQPVEIPDGEVTEESFKTLLAGSDKFIGEYAKDCFALHLADKARAVDAVQAKWDKDKLAIIELYAEVNGLLENIDELKKWIDDEIVIWSGMHEEEGKNQATSGAIIALKDVKRKLAELKK